MSCTCGTKLFCSYKVDEQLRNRFKAMSKALKVRPAKPRKKRICIPRLKIREISQTDLKRQVNNEEDSPKAPEDSKVHGNGVWVEMELNGIKPRDFQKNHTQALCSIQF